MKRHENHDPAGSIGGRLNLFGLNIDLGKLLSAPETVTAELDQLRQKLKDLGAAETLSDEEWRSGRPSVSGQLRIGVLGRQREYHMGTGHLGRPPREKPPAPSRPPMAEPATDVFYEPDEVVVVCEVPGVAHGDLTVQVDGREITIATVPSARWQYRKTLQLERAVEPEPREVTCRNGMLEVRLSPRRQAG